MAYKVKLQAFEGPFDLLVYLIENARMSIYDIRVSEITAQYIDYIEQMQMLDVNVSSEFMVLAAELIELKSKMLLPRQVDPSTGDFVEEDPRADLVGRILEYKKYKHISEYLGEAEQRAFRVREKPQEDLSEYLQDPEEYLVLDMDKFMSAFDAFLTRKKKLEEIRTRYERIQRERYTQEQRIDCIKGRFEKDPNKKVNFKDTLGGDKDSYDVVVSFASMLEMIRKKKLTAEQRALFADIYLKAREGLFLPDEPEDDEEAAEAAGPESAAEQ